jgi:hypothetical protein
MAEAELAAARNTAEEEKKKNVFLNEFGPRS